MTGNFAGIASVKMEREFEDIESEGRWHKLYMVSQVSMLLTFNSPELSESVKKGKPVSFAKLMLIIDSTSMPLKIVIIHFLHQPTCGGAGRRKKRQEWYGGKMERSKGKKNG